MTSAPRISVDLMQTWGAIFDWDGVIIDSSRQHEESWELLAREGDRLLPPDHFKRSFGMKNEQIIPELLGWTREPTEIRRLSLRKEELYRQIIRERGITPLPGVVELLGRLREAVVPAAVGSSTHRLNITTTLIMLGLDEMFQAIVTAEDVTHGKPDPEVFLLAAQRIGVPAARCVVFEDTQVGIQAACDGGMKVIGVAATHPAAKLRGANRVVHRLDELTIAELGKLF
ncbi:MAG: HAD family phosphatase [Verrucomicrobiia bacterium]